jgi:tRNA A-37 threonylcarbamoyl transferase component Bud32
MRALALLSLLAAAANAAPAPGQGAADAERLELGFSSSVRRMEAGLRELHDLRLSFPNAPDLDARIAQADRRIKGLEASLTEANDLRGKHRKVLQSLFAFSVSKGAFAYREHRFDPDSDQARLIALEHAGDEMHSQTDALRAGLNREEEEFSAFCTELQRRRSARRGRAVAVGALAALLAAAALAWRAGGPPAPAPPPAPPMPELAAGNFSVVGLLGQGSMGEVYEAVDTSLNRRAALKRLRPKLLSDPAELESLLKEARLMAALKHPNLLAVYSVEKDAGQVYIAMELVDGVSLQRRLDAESRLPWPEALRIARGVGAALDYAHGMRLIHRDLKPANVMLSTKGEVKVMDFGIAYQAAKSVSRLTRAPTWGTPPYMAPEQELGGVSAAVDLYALSVCLYEMLTGELPFKGPNFLAQKREALWTPPGRLVPGLPAGIDGLFAIALAPEPSRRFKDAAALLAACAALNS